MENPHFQCQIVKTIKVIQIVPAFALELKDIGISILYKIKAYFGVAKIQIIKK